MLKYHKTDGVVWYEARSIGAVLRYKGYRTRVDRKVSKQNISTVGANLCININGVYEFIAGMTVPKSFIDMLPPPEEMVAIQGNPQIALNSLLEELKALVLKYSATDVTPKAKPA